MKIQRFLFIVCILFLIAGSAVAQSDNGASENDPFKNDPFFYKPINDLLKPSINEDAIQPNTDDRDIKALVTQLNREGLDYNGTIEAGPYNSSMLYSLYPNLPMVHFNRVSGIFLGIKKERMQWYGKDWLLNIPRIHLHGLLGYSFSQHEWEYTIGIERLFGPRKHVMWGFEYHDASATNDYWRVGLTETSITSFLAGYDYLDYYKQAGYGTYLLLRSNRFFEGGVSYTNDTFTSLKSKSDFAVFGSGDRYRLNPVVDWIQGLPVDTLNVSTLAFSGSFNPKKLLLSRYFSMGFSGLVEISDPGFGNSDYVYQKYAGEIFAFINFEPGGVLKYRLKMGSITGEAPTFKEFQLGGVGSLRAIPYKSLPGPLIDGGHYANQMLLSNIELQFGRPMFGSHGWIDSDNFYISLFLDSGWTHYSSKLADATNPLTDFSAFDISDLRHNGGIGLGSSFIRCELAWDLNGEGGAKAKPILWIRFNPTF